MKLYATVTSERASKGQGGNKYLKVELKVEHRNQVFGTLWLHQDGSLELLNAEGVQVFNMNAVAFQEARETRGEKQKGETPEQAYEREAGEDDTVISS